MPSTPLPPILAGPILRRVEADLVSVWIALPQPASVTMTLFVGGAIHAGSGELHASGTASTVKVGDQLHIALVEIDLDPGKVLGPGQTYSYQLSIGTDDLDSLHLLEDNEPDRLALGYEDHVLPSFTFSPLDLEKLIVFHGSCRKPHGTGPDALAYVDDLIKDGRTDGTRPHQLFLTGDQIYADDVSSALLPYLNELGIRLVGTETLMIEGTPREVTLQNFPADRRKDFVVGHAAFTSDDCDSHLLSFGEFCAMYLVAWSMACHPAENQLADENAILEATGGTSDVEKLLTKVPRKSSEAKKRHREFKAGTKALKKFREALPKVQRALANVPVFMILDDHEITDDWYLSGEWRTNVLANLIGRAIVRNGLAAYTLFQAWGNDPRYFRTAEGVAVLDAAQKYVSGGVATDAFDAAAIQGKPAWHYWVDGPSHRVIVLDTRTRRKYESPRAAPGLIDDPMALAEQFPSAPPPGPITFVVSAAPVLGVGLFEEVIQPLYKTVAGFIRKTGEPRGQMKADFEAWAFAPASFEALLQQLSPLGDVVLLGGDVHYSFSASMTYWQRTGAVTTARHIAQLTSSALKNQWPNAAALFFSEPLGQAIFGLVPPLERLAWRDHHGMAPPWPAKLLGLAHFHEYRLFRNPILMPTKGWTAEALAPADQPDWKWRVTLIRDERADSDRPKAARPEPPTVTVDAANIRQGYRDVAERHARQLQKAAPRRTFWASSIGKVSFHQDSGGPFIVRHELLSVNDDAKDLDKDKPLPYTAFELPFAVGAEIEPIVP